MDLIILHNYILTQIHADQSGSPSLSNLKRRLCFSIYCVDGKSCWFCPTNIKRRNLEIAQRTTQRIVTTAPPPVYRYAISLYMDKSIHIENHWFILGKRRFLLDVIIHQQRQRPITQQHRLCPRGPCRVKYKAI